MKILGGIIGFVFGAAGFSLGAGVVCAVLGVLAGHFLALLLRDTPPAKDVQGPGPDPVSLDLLTRRLARLEARIEQLERTQAEHPPEGADRSAAAMPAPPVAPAAPMIEPPTPAGASLSEDVGAESAAGEAAASVVEPVPPEGGPAPAGLPPPTVAEPPLAGAEPPGPGEPSSPAAPPAGLRDHLPGWLDTLLFAGNPLAKVGVLILFLGLAFLLRYTAEHVSLPIEFRYASVAATGVGLLLLGWRMRERRDRYGLILQGAGVATLYLTTLAAMKLHPLVPPGFGFSLLFAVAILTALLAVLQDALILAVVAALGGFAAPVLASTGSGNHVALFGYLALLDAGILIVAWFKTWRILNLIGFAGTLLLGLTWGQHRYHPGLFWSTQPFLLLFFLMFAAITVLFARNTQAEAREANRPFAERARQALPQVAYVDAGLTFGLPIAGFGLQYMLVRHLEYGAAWSALALSAFYLALGWLLLTRNHAQYLLLVEAFAALGTVFVTLAVPLAFDSAWTSAAWAVEAAGIYWIGLRQDRRHGRLFALGVLAGSAIFFFRETSWTRTPALLAGSPLGCLLIAASALFVFARARGQEDRLAPGEAALLAPVALGGAVFVYLAPAFLVGLDGWCVALALLGFASLLAAARWRVAVWRAAGLGAQALAGLLFATSLHGGDGLQVAVLGNGATGLAVALVLGTAMLAAGWFSAPGREENGENRGAVVLGTAAVVILLLGLVFVNLAALFVLPWRHVTGLWAVSGLVTLVIGLRLASLWMALFALILQGIAGLAFLATGVPSGPPYFAPLPGISWLRHSGWWTPMTMSLAAFGCAFLYRVRDDDRAGQSAVHETALLAWGVGWWAFACWGEILRFVPGNFHVTTAVAAVTASIALWGGTAYGLGWRGLYWTTGLLLLVLVPLGLYASLDFGHPAAHAGWLVWPLALALHVALLRGPEGWVDRPSRQGFHVVGAWLFVGLATVEAGWQCAQLGEPGSAWAMPGWAMGPVAYLAAVSSAWGRGRWPLTEEPRAYRLIAAAPLLVYGLGFALLSNLSSRGSAAPLPYLPLMNPLEIAQAAVILGGLLWVRGAVDDPDIGLGKGDVIGHATAGGAAFACLTGGVLRASHHWAGIGWGATQMMESTLVQTALSVTWTLVALALMVVGNRRGWRPLWCAGAALVAVVVAKLFFVELAHSGSLARIVSFIVVGGLLLVVGRLAPVPPRTVAPESLQP